MNVNPWTSFWLIFGIFTMFMGGTLIMADLFWLGFLHNMFGVFSLMRYHFLIFKEIERLKWSK